MIFIDIDDLEVSADWLERASDALADVAAAQETERSKIINKYQSIWKELKDPLRDLSYKKCWYCESKDNRSDNAVDHFRPKGNVKDVDPPHHGYWWLAFNWRNYRFSCTYCNSIRKSAGDESGGKQDYFPLVDEDHRARRREESIGDEIPALLDPTSLSDVQLLAFTDDGSAATITDQEQTWDYKRAKVSIKRYHLDHPDIRERRGALMKRTREKLEKAQEHLKRYQKNNTDAYAKSNYDSLLCDLYRAARRNSEFSAAARYTIAGMSETNEVAKKLLEKGFG